MSQAAGYPAAGDIVYHAMERNNEPWEIVNVAAHPDPRKTQQRAITLRGQWSQRERTFEMSAKNFWFNWKRLPAHIAKGANA
jgi:hypothetical protein